MGNLVVVCILATLLGLLAGPALVGLRPLTVLTSSMEPDLRPGDVVLLREVDPSAIRPGDVLTYLPAGSAPDALPVTHRLTGFVAAADGSQDLILKGDANSVPDAPVPAAAVQGRVVATLPYAGYPDLLAERGQLSWLRPGLAIALFGYGTLLVFQHFRQGRSSRSSQGPTA